MHQSVKGRHVSAYIYRKATQGDRHQRKATLITY